MQRWYVIQIVPQLRKVAGVNLERQGYRYFFPRLATKVSSRGVILETQPLFKGYGFVQLDLDTDHWTPIRSTRGVLRMLPVSSLLPRPIETDFVDFLLENSPLAKVEKLTEIVQDYAPGMIVRINRGVLEGYYGTIVMQQGKLFEVLLNIKNKDQHLRNPLIPQRDLTVI